MKRIFGVLFLTLCLSAHVYCDYSEDTWVEPDAWSQENSLKMKSTATEDCKCENAVSYNQEETVALVYFKKFLNTLFQRSKLHYNEKANVFERSLMFKISTNQLERLKQLNDPRDLDILLTEILSNLHTTQSEFSSMKISMSFVALILDIFKDFAQLLKTSEMQFISIVLSGILLGWFLNRRYKFGIITLTVGSMFIIGYFATYLDCNAKLEVKQMMEALERSETLEPRWYTFITDYVGLTKEVTLNDHIRKANRLNLNFCRPDYVLQLYFNDLFFKQLEVLMQKCTTTLMNVKNELSFPFNYIAAVLLIVLVAYIIKWTFKYILSPKAWSTLLHCPQLKKNNAITQQEPVGEITGDRISGENLKLLLHAISAPSRRETASVESLVLQVSGVQECLEGIEGVQSSSSNNSASDLESSGSSSRSINKIESTESLNASSSSPKKKLENNNNSKGDIDGKKKCDRNDSPTKDNVKLEDDSDPDTWCKL